MPGVLVLTRQPGFLFIGASLSGCVDPFLCAILIFPLFLARLSFPLPAPLAFIGSSDFVNLDVWVVNLSVFFAYIGDGSSSFVDLSIVLNFITVIPQVFLVFNGVGLSSFVIPLIVPTPGVVKMPVFLTYIGVGSSPHVTPIALLFFARLRFSAEVLLLPVPFACRKNACISNVCWCQFVSPCESCCSIVFCLFQFLCGSSSFRCRKSVGLSDIC